MYLLIAFVYLHILFQVRVLYQHVLYLENDEDADADADADANADADADADADANADADADADTNTNKDLPSDLFDFLKLQFQPLETYTSDEIIKIAHYLKACELIKLEDYNYTYSIMISGNYNNEYEDYIIGDIEHCDGTSIYDDEDACCHKRYANVITKFTDITLDDTSILNHTRVN